MKEFIRKSLLIFLCLYSLFFVVGSVLAPIMAFCRHFELSALLTSTYMFSCHQQPDRSFWLLGYPIALCCRCLGVYFSTAVSAVLAFYNRLNISRRAFLIMFIISLADIFINYGMGKHNNTGNITRFIIGILMGILIVSALNHIFKLKRR